MLHSKLVQAIKETQSQLLDQGKLYPSDRLQGYYVTFRERFGPDVLRNLDGEVLLHTMHDLRRTNRNSLSYWLEFKNDDEFPAIFGSISGGSALKFGVYPNAATGKWMTRDARNYPIEITLEEAIEIARRHRDQLLRGSTLLESLPANAADEDYRALQQLFDEQLPNVSLTAWGHKYFSLLYPDKLDDYHMASFQRFYLVKLLEPNIPDERAGRYIAAGRFVRIALELGMPMNHLTTVLNGLNGRPYTYWSILASDPHNPEALQWSLQREAGFAAVTWSELGDLSGLAHNTESKKSLRQRMDPVYPKATTVERQGLFDFVTDIAVNDLVVAFEPRSRKAVGIGRVTGGYYYESSTAPHRLPVDWLSADEWQFPDEEGFDTAARVIRTYANQVEVERHLLEAVPAQKSEAKPAVVVVQPAPKPAPVRLSGLPGYVQAILERKGQVILYGPPGTGKTYWAETTACELVARQCFGAAYKNLEAAQKQRVFGTTDSYVRLCSFHPTYGYEDFLEGYRPHIANGQMAFARQNGIFKQLCDQARSDSEHNYYLIIDEINRGDIPRIFGELLTVLEKDKRGKAILLPLSREGFSVPSNVYVLGTMNTADRSIALLDTALRRRFGFVELLPDPDLLGSTVLDGIPLAKWLGELNHRILQNIGHDARNLQIGHAYFLESGKPLADFAKFARVIREDIIPLLEEYCYEDYTALEKILGTALVNREKQIINHDLFETGNAQQLAQALLELTPELMTLASVTQAEGEQAENGEDLDSSSAGDEA